MGTATCSGFPLRMRADVEGLRDLSGEVIGEKVNKARADGDGDSVFESDS